jgi:hypothetical protein
MNEILLAAPCADNQSTAEQFSQYSAWPQCPDPVISSSWYSMITEVLSEMIKWQRSEANLPPPSL